MSSGEYRRRWFGNEVVACKAYKKSGDGMSWRGEAKALREGVAVETFDEADVETAVERAWCWCCMHRVISVWIKSDLVESGLFYVGPEGGVPVKIYTATSKERAERAERVFRELLLAQWTRELEEHERRRECLPAHVQVLAGELEEIMAKIEPLKKEAAGVKLEIAKAPQAVFAIDLEDNTIASLAEEMARIEADEAFDEARKPRLKKPPKKRGDK
jgi:hypothetical protein